MVNLPGISCDIDLDQVVYQVALTWPDGAGTLYRAVRRLPAGCQLTFDGRQVAVTRYWRPEAPPATIETDPEVRAAGLRQVLIDSVRARLAWSSRVGVGLSGGLDSSTIAVLARDAGRQPLPVFTAAYPQARASDETTFSDAIVADGGFESQTVHPAEMDMLSAGILAGTDEPFTVPQAGLHASLFGAAERAGVDLFLTGEGGDELLDDYNQFRLTELAGQGRWRELLWASRAMPGPLPWRQVLGASAPGPVLSAWRRLGPHPQAPIRPAVARRAGLPQLAARQIDLLRPRRASEGIANVLADPSYERVYEDVARIGDHFGVTVSHPFLDPSVIAYALSLPASDRSAAGWTRPLLRRSMPSLPAIVRRRRTKTNLSSGFVAAFPINSMAEVTRLLDRPPEILRELLDWGAVRQAATDSPRAVAAGPAFALWRVISVAAWLERLLG
ncbi:MAG: hypothetical protein NVS9B1_18340 [Candidatus Dormibacteraceae bacterium]